jgi:hypothetical protein
MSKPESKQDQIVAFLRSGQGDDLTNNEIADQFVCNEGTVRRARKAVDAERQADQMIERGASSDDALEALRSILAADELEETLLASLEEVKEELKSLKETLKDAAAKARSVRRTVRENHPLFDRQPALNVHHALNEAM